MDEELCDGNTALVNPTTGYDYDCMNGRETCPAGSYCHRVDSSAKCCKEGKANSGETCINLPRAAKGCQEVRRATSGSKELPIAARAQGIAKNC